MNVAGSAGPQPAPELGATVSTRSAAIDHIRIVLTALVILHHAAITYGGSGGWYWREQQPFSNMLLVTFNATNQSFFMGFFFLLAGYFTPGSFTRKGAGHFLSDRFIRLGIPLLGYFFFISPLTIALANRVGGQSLWQTWWQMTLDAQFGPGPLWFAQALLLFTLAYVGWKTLRPRAAFADVPGHGTLILLSLVLAVIAFLVRLAVPVGDEVLWLQLGYFPAYVFLFGAGCLLAGTRALEHVPSAKALPWMGVSAAMVVVVWFVIQHPPDNGRFEGGISLNAGFYALWDPFTAWGFMLGMLWACQRFWNKQSRLTRWLAQRAYGAYIVHPPVLVACSVMLVAWAAEPVWKFLAVGALAIVGSFLLAAMLLLVPGAKRVL